MASELFTADFWQRTFSQAVHTAAGAAVTPLATQELGMLHSVPWYAIASAAAIGGLMSVLLSLASIKVPGTVPASFVPTKFVEGDGNAP
jgi:ABC-type branched-subunit amino acid transport system permease subunit